MKHSKTSSIFFRILIACLTIWGLLLAGCLDRVGGDPRDSGPLLPGEMELDGFPVEAAGIRPEDTDSDLSPSCWDFVDCICSFTGGMEYQECIDAYIELIADDESFTDDYCEWMLEQYYPEC